MKNCLTSTADSVLGVYQSPLCTSIPPLLEKEEGWDVSFGPCASAQLQPRG